MTGIERLQGMPMAFRGYTWGASLYEALADIAEQIKREHAEDCFRMGERAADVSMSAYDLLPEEDREAIAWVRGVGGLDEVRKLARHETKEEVELVALGKLRCLAGVRQDEAASIAEMVESIARRLMPEGVEWPRYESGEPVRFGGDFLDHQDNVRSVLSVKMFKEGVFEIGTGQGTYDWHSAGERVRRPAVLAADGEPLEVGQTVWRVDDGREFYVYDIDPKWGVGVSWQDGDSEATGSINPDQLTHQLPVLDADGVPICVEDTVYLLPGEWCDEWPCLGFHGGEELVVTDLHTNHQSGGIRCSGTKSSAGCYPQPSQLTHTKPERDSAVFGPRTVAAFHREITGGDSWERIEEDARGLDSGVDRELFTHTHEDLVRRCKALAERERGK